ncbi:MAG: bdbD 1 [Rickettsiaceae bacterium]|jgi:protein-disulfide isomerase|nr:bdbD 1 [Rickettsiaceae bacterium]
MANKSAAKLLSPKAIVIVILLAVILGGAYAVISKKYFKTNEEDANLIIKSSGLDSDQSIKNVGDVEKVIAKWIEANPEAIIQSVVSMQQKAAEKNQKDAKKNISSKKNDLLKNKNDPVYAPKGYDVSVIEFFDYNCGYCKKAQAVVEELVKQDKKVRVVFKELPILGSSSVELAKVSIAVSLIDAEKYLTFHAALMKSNVSSKKEAIEIAKSLGVDEKKLEKTLESKKSEIESQIKANQELASSIGIGGTPAFVIGEELIPGAVDIATLKEKISGERKK